MNTKRQLYPSDASREADTIIAEKDQRYASRWREYEIISLADVALSKFRRVKVAILNEDWDEAEEETIDGINYGRFLWCKLKEEGRQ